MGLVFVMRYLWFYLPTILVDAGFRDKTLFKLCILNNYFLLKETQNTLKPAQIPASFQSVYFCLRMTHILNTEEIKLSQDG